MQVHSGGDTMRWWGHSNSTLCGGDAKKNWVQALAPGHLVKLSLFFSFPFSQGTFESYVCLMLSVLLHVCVNSACLCYVRPLFLAEISPNFDKIRDSCLTMIRVNVDDNLLLSLRLLKTVCEE